MTDRATLLDLAARCEAASGPDRALDFMILKRLRGLRDLGAGLYEMENWYYSLNDDDPSEKNPPFPSPTSSLDAALTEARRYGFIAALGDIAADGLPGCCICTSTDPVREVWGVCAGGGDDLNGRLAPAEVAAALRARAEEANNDR